MRCRKPGYSRLYVANPWSQIGCTSLCSKVKYSRFGTRGLLRKDETARFSTPQLDHIASERAAGSVSACSLSPWSGRKRKGPFENRDKHRNFSFVTNLIQLNITAANINGT